MAIGAAFAQSKIDSHPRLDAKIPELNPNPTKPMNTQLSKLLGVIGLTALVALNSNAATVLYDQNFENPVGFVNDGGDVNIFRTVNDLYGNQPPGFLFSQQWTVETLNITGIHGASRAFGTGYSDPSGRGGNYALGMLSSVQNDLLGLSFDVGVNRFLNVRLDISSIDLSVFGGPFVPSDSVPTFQFTLYDNPGGVAGLGAGTILDQHQAVGTASAQNVFDWTEVLLPLDASGTVNGKVILRVDLLTGGYAAIDNLRIASSDIAGDVGTNRVPENSATAVLLVLAMGLLGYCRSRVDRTLGHSAPAS